MNMPSFQHTTPALRLYSGPDSLAGLARELDRMKCKRAVLFCGPWMAQGPLMERIAAALGERQVGVFSDVLGHSPVASVEAAATLLNHLQADAVIAVGGGSSIVTARAASILAAEGKSCEELCTTTDAAGKIHSPKLLAAKLPQLIVPTTPTTAIVKAGSAVFDPVQGKRLAMYDPKTRAQSVFIDPDMVMSAPRELVISASINTFSMAIEGLTSNAKDPMADALLMHVLRLLAQHLPGIAAHDSAALRADLVVAGVMCGQGTDHTAAGITTVLGHAIGARYEKENGIVNAIVLPHVLRFNGEAASAGMTKVAAALGLPNAAGQAATDGAIQAVKAFVATLGIPSRLRDIGIPREHLAELSQLAMGDWFLKGNPRPVTGAHELQSIMKEAW